MRADKWAAKQREREREEKGDNRIKSQKVVNKKRKVEEERKEKVKLFNVYKA